MAFALRNGVILFYFDMHQKFDKISFPETYQQLTSEGIMYHYKIQQIANTAKYLNPALKRIAEYILANMESCKNITNKSLANACQVAESTVTRFVKEVGFKNFQELKIAITESLTLSNEQVAKDTDEFVYEDITTQDDIDTISNKILYKNIHRMQEAKSLINTEQVKKATQAINQASNLFFVSMGSSSVATYEAVMRFTRAGKRCIFWQDQSMQSMAAATASGQDVFIGISVSGRTHSVIQALKLAKASGATVIAITSDSESPLAKLAPIVLYTPEKNDSSNSSLSWESTSLKNAQILVMDILYACYAVQNDEATLTNLNKTFESLRSTRE